MNKNITRRRYEQSVLVSSLLYALALLGDNYAFKHQLLTGIVAYLAAAPPALPIIGMFAVMGRYLIQEGMGMNTSAC